MASYPRAGAGSRVVKAGSKAKASTVAPPPSAKAVMLHTKRRMEKAERDERVDITKALTEVKTYMGGFTRPQDLRASNWFPGGAYVENGKVYESPPPAAYEPHTVFLLQSRHYTKHGVGRADSLEHVVGVCREGDLPQVLAKYNSEYCPQDEKEIMDNAHWPWLEPKRAKRAVWWDKAETKEEALALREKEIQGEQAASSSIPMDMLSAPQPPTGVSVQRRAYHSSSRVSASTDTPRTSASERRKIPASAWSRPHKPSQDADDNVVPAYYIERKRQRDDIEQRKETEGNLMSQLSAGILSEGIAAQTRVREGKVPVEVIEEDGTVRLPSGFEPPTPATEFHPVAAMPPAEDGTPLVTEGKVSWDEVLEPADASATASSSMSSSSAGVRGIHTSAVTRASGVPRSSTKERRKIPASAWSRPHKPSQDADDNVVPAYYIERKRQRDAIEHRKETEGNLMSQLSAGILSEGIAAQTRVREGKIPVEVVEKDGTVRLASGFELPTPATRFHPVAAVTPVKNDNALKVSWDHILTPDIPASTFSSMSSTPSGTRGFHTNAVARAAEVPMNLLSVGAPEPPMAVKQIASKVVKAEQNQEEDLMEDEYYSEADVEALSGAVSPVASSASEYDSKLGAHRARYMATLEEQPFWRPVMTATFSTRPLAISYARLSRSLPRGLAYYAAIEEESRKYGPTYSSRISSMRTRRMRQLALEMAKRLRGDRGGFPGIRFSTEAAGRGVNGEGLADPIPADKRTIQIGVGEWHPFGQELKTLFTEEAQDAELESGLKIFGLDDFGRRSDGEAWPAAEARLPSKRVAKAAATKKELEAIAVEKGREIAFAASQRMRSVEYPLSGAKVPVAKFLEAYKAPVVSKAQWRS